MRERAVFAIYRGASACLRMAAQLLDQLTQLSREGGRNFLDISHLNRAALPGGKYLLNTLTKNTVALRDAAAAPSEEKIKLHRLALQIGTVVLGEGGHLGRKADAVSANLPPQFAQGKFLNFVDAHDPRPNAINGRRCRR
jgi:hypothetical protein